MSENFCELVLISVHCVFSANVANGFVNFIFFARLLLFIFFLGKKNNNIDIEALMIFSAYNTYQRNAL